MLEVWAELRQDAAATVFGFAVAEYWHILAFSFTRPLFTGQASITSPLRSSIKRPRGHLGNKQIPSSNSEAVVSGDGPTAQAAATPADAGGSGVLACWGRLVRSMLDRGVCISALSVECALTAVRPSTWTSPVRGRFSRQILFSGVEALSFTFFAGLLIGAVTTLNAMRVLTLTGELDSLAAVIAILFVREGAPFFAMVITICASMSAMTSEISTMRLSGEVELIESQGVNSVQFIAVPRALGLAITSVGLSLIFATAAISASYVTIAISGRVLPGPFVTSIFKAITFLDLVNLVGRSSVAAYIATIACYYEGMKIEGAAATKVPQAVTRAMLCAVAITLVVSTVFALFTYSS